MQGISQTSLKMNLEEFNYFRSKIFDLAGISLSDAKLDLIQARLRHRILALSLSDYKDYQKYLERLPTSHEEWEVFINLLTTNKTDWFREPEHFTFINQEFLPKWLKLNKKHLSVWCAASSTGEEPYTLSLVLNKALQGSGVSYDILATDIDTKVLGLARNGVYPKERLGQVPETYHHSGFCFGRDEISDWVKVRKEIKAPVKFQQLNLTTGPFGLKQDFDLVLCRNVLIYFSPQTISKVAESLHQCASKDGVLLIAHSESLQNINASWKYVRPSIYQKGKLI
jgi:chemotaxis protein methyltransferase CheR